MPASNPLKSIFPFIFFLFLCPSEDNFSCNQS